VADIARKEMQMERPENSRRLHATPPRNTPVIPALAAIHHAGLRPTNVMTIRACDVDLASGHLRIPSRTRTTVRPWPKTRVLRGRGDSAE
jgi:hypothetical protein